MSASRRSWEDAGATCQHRGDPGKMRAQHASIAMILAGRRRNLPALSRTWHVSRNSYRDLQRAFHACDRIAAEPDRFVFKSDFHPSVATQAAALTGNVS